MPTCKSGVAPSSQVRLPVVADTREQAPYSFAGAACYEGTTVETGTLQTGDYSIRGLEGLVAVERKALPDLVACLGRERDRFVRELERGRGLDAFAVVVEGSFMELSQGQYRSQLNPHAAVQSIASFMARWRIPFLFAGSRPAAEYAVWSFLRQYLEGKRHELRAVERALGLRPARQREGGGTTPVSGISETAFRTAPGKAFR